MKMVDYHPGLFLPFTHMKMVSSRSFLTHHLYKRHTIHWELWELWVCSHTVPVVTLADLKTALIAANRSDVFLAYNDGPSSGQMANGM